MRPAQHPALAAEKSAVTGHAAVGASDPSAALPACASEPAMATTSSSQSFPRAGGSRDGHCPCYVNSKCSSGSSHDAVHKEFLDKATESGEVLQHHVFEPSPMLAAAKATRPIQQPLRELLKARGVYNARKASPAVCAAMAKHLTCSPQTAIFNLIGENSIQIKRKINKQLARELAEGSHDRAFAAMCDVHDCPRADDIEAMVASFPAWESIDWEAPAVTSGLDVGLWQAWHARHCAKCSELAVHDSCYFKLVLHFLRTGFEPPTPAGVRLESAAAVTKAYVDLWNKEKEGCETAFKKWVDQAENLMSEATNEVPEAYFPILPVVREKDRWLFEKFALAYKVRLCLDFKSGLLNDWLLDWPFRYVGIEDIAAAIRPGDWLATVDISRFYLRLPAGKKLRNVQWFQDPSSYATDSHNNQHMSDSKRRFRQLLAVAFGLKSAPAWASVVSAELARILRSNRYGTGRCEEP